MTEEFMYPSSERRAMVVDIREVVAPGRRVRELSWVGGCVRERKRFCILIGLLVGRVCVFTTDLNSLLCISFTR